MLCDAVLCYAVLRSAMRRSATHSRTEKCDLVLIDLQAVNLETQLKQTQKMFESSKLSLTQAIEACNFATKKRRAAERQLAKLQVCFLCCSKHNLNCLFQMAAVQGTVSQVQWRQSVCLQCKWKPEHH